MLRHREIPLAKYYCVILSRSSSSTACVSDPVCDNAVLDQVHVHLLKITIVKYLSSWEKLLPSSSHLSHLAVLEAHAVTRFNLFEPAAAALLTRGLLQAHESTAQTKDLSADHSWVPGTQWKLTWSHFHWFEFSLESSSTILLHCNPLTLDITGPTFV